VLVYLTETGRIARETVVAGALECNRRLLEPFNRDQVAFSVGPIDRLSAPPPKRVKPKKILS